jgi:pyruvate kinase
MERRAKIVATIGPASQEEATLEQLCSAGMNVARLNFSHGSHENYASVIERLRSVSARMQTPLCILQDLQGPKLRVGSLPAEGIDLRPGEQITLATKSSNENEAIPVEFAELPQFVTKGGRILLDDGNLELEAISVKKHSVDAKVLIGGTLHSKKGINLPGTQIDIPGFTEKDERDLISGLNLGIDMVAISFVRSAEDVIRVRQAIRKHAPDKVNTPIIAKLERAEALENLSEIVEAADGVMVARGDLGVEMPPESVPIAQKQIIDAANREGKLVITATQMLDSMIHNPRPTRAEASDVANAIFDGTDAVMLSGETATGKYAIESVAMMDAIINESESHSKRWGHWKGSTHSPTREDAISITQAARELAHDLSVAAITVFTQSGRTARLMSKAFPRVPIFGFTPEESTYNRMAMYWGVFPYLVDLSNNIEDMLASLEATTLEKTSVKPGEQVVVISGFPVGDLRSPNLAMLYTIGQNT